MKKYTGTYFLFISLMFIQLIVNGQKRFAMDLNAGLALGHTSIPSLPGYMGSYSLRYNFNPVISFEAIADLGMIRGKQTVKSFTGTDYPENFTDYTTKFQMLSGNFNFNLARLFKFTGERSRINPYFIVGIGSLHNDAIANRADGKVRVFNYITYQWVTGFAIRYYLNPTYDLKTGINYYYTQTYYMDAIHKDRVYDQYASIYIGLSWKIGASKSEEHIEWKDLIHKRSIPKAPKKKRTKIKQPDEISKVPDAETIVKPNEAEITSEQKKEPIQITEAQKSDPLTANQSGVVEPESGKVEAPIQKGYVPTTQVKTKPPVVVENPNTPPAIIDPDIKQPEQNIVGEESKRVAVTPKADSNYTNSDLTLEVNEPKPISVSAPVQEVASPAIAPVQKYRPAKIETLEEVNTSSDPAIKKEKKVKGERRAIRPILKNDQVSAIKVEGDKPTEKPEDFTSIRPPLARYNVIVASFYSTKYARRYVRKIRNEGYEAYLFKSSPGSKLIRVSVFSDPSKPSTLHEMRKIRSTMEPDAWIHIYKGE